MVSHASLNTCTALSGHLTSLSSTFLICRMRIPMLSWEREAGKAKCGNVRRALSTVLGLQYVLSI